MGENNVDIKTGRLCDDAQLFMTKSGRPKIVFRLAVRRTRDMPPKHDGNNADFFTIVAYGERFVDLLPRLKKGVLVTVVGFTQSRDLPDGRVVVETVARRIYVDSAVQESREDSGD